MDTKHIAIIGAGPIGLEAALYATHLGYKVSVFEKASVANHIKQWQHVTFFSPFKMNASTLGREYLSQTNHTLPDDDSYLSGNEFRNKYLLPLADTPAIKDLIHSGVEVISVARSTQMKRDMIGDPARATFPFRLLLRKEDGNEFVETADVVLDCSGTFSNANWLGEGGIPAIGEQGLQSSIEYGIANFKANAKQYANKTMLLIGNGHSAATTLANFEDLCATAPGSRLIWITRSDNTPPFSTIESDPLQERTRIIDRANRVAQSAAVTRISGALIQSIQKKTDTSFTVEIRQGDSFQSIEADQILACVGHSPDNSLYSELQIHECYASRGPMSLAAALLGDSSEDCLAQTSKGAEVLKNPEPNFYIIGMKSYGKSPNFLLRIGHEQIRDVFQLIKEDSALDLYRDVEHQSLTM